MIKYPEDVSYQYMEHQIGKDRKKLLEKTLRLIGNFDENDPIIIENYEYGETYSDLIYKVKDKNNTTFSFINFGLGGIEDHKRYAKNFYLTMQRENSPIKYTYDFSNLAHELDFLDDFRVNEIELKLSESRVLKLKRHEQVSQDLIVEEENRKYRISLSEEDNNLLENFEEMSTKIKNIKNLNLSEILNVIGDLNKVSSCYIDNEQHGIKAAIYLRKGNVNEYRIETSSNTIRVHNYDGLSRKTERKTDDETITTEEKITSENCDKIKREVKMLMKTI